MASEELENQKNINKELRETERLKKKIRDQDNTIRNSSKDLQDQRDISNQIRDQLKNLKFQKTERSEILSITRALNRVAVGATITNAKDLGTQKSINKIIRDRATLQNALNQLSTVGGNITELNLEALLQLEGAFEDLEISAKKVNQALLEQQEFSEAVADSFNVKFFQNIANIIKAIPGLREFSTPFEDAASSARELVITQTALNKIKKDREALETGKGLTADVVRRLGLQKQLSDEQGKTLAGVAAFNKARTLNISKNFEEIKDVPNLFKPTLAAFSSLGKTIKSSIGPAFFALTVSELLKINSETVELQKAFAITSSDAEIFRGNLARAAQQTDNINITTSALLKTVTALSKQFGFPTLFSTDTLITTTKLTQQVGISAEAAGRLAAATVSTRENFEEQYLNALGTSFELQRQAGIQFDLRDILEESGKVTGVVRANLGANIPSIAEAVTQAKLFGGALNDVAGASKALLDFESSITAELEAELLLGKNINLETARQAALNGDLVTLTKELTREAGSFEEFTKLNVIQQEALAKSLGMQSDQIADILFQQDIQNKTASELRAAGKEELAQRLEAQTAQEKFTKSVEKLKGLFGDIVVAFMPILDLVSIATTVLAQIINYISPLLKFLTAAIAAPISLINDAVTGQSAFTTSKTVAGMRVDDLMLPPAGYGNTIIKRGEDTIALNNDDTIVAGTNLGGGSNQTGERTNQLLETLIMQNSKKPEISPVGLYEVQ